MSILRRVERFARTSFDGPTPPRVLVPMAASWKYLANGSDQAQDVDAGASVVEVPLVVQDARAPFAGHVGGVFETGSKKGRSRPR